jgi:hypothetical protein
VEFGICALWNRRAPMPACGHRFIEALTRHIALDALPRDAWTRPTRLHAV